MTCRCPAKHHLDRRAEDLIANRPAGEPDKLLSTAELAEWLGVSKQWLEIGRSRGYGPPFIRIAPRRIRYSRKAVITWLDARSHRATSEYIPQKPEGTERTGNGKDA